MSELAHNLNGESFEVPPAAVAWRVRKLKAKGAPEVVYGREGIPLILPIDAAAVLIGAAQNAGMPQRLPRFFLDAGENTEEGQDEPTDAATEGEPAKPAPKGGLHALFETIVSASAPALVNAIVNGQIKIP